MLENMIDLGGNDLIWREKPELPAANEENKKLEESLKQKKIEVERLKAVLEKNISKGSQMRQYFSDLSQTLTYKQQLYKSREHELEIEKSAQKIMDRECSRLEQEIKQANQDISTLKERQKLKEAAISQQLQKKEDLKGTINCDENLFLQHLQRSVQLEKDNMALIKYTAEDDSKIRELEIQNEKLSTEAHDRKSALVDADTEVFILQSELDRMQKEFLNAHTERKDLISNWENVMNQIKQRNEESERLSEYIENMRKEEIDLKNKLKEQEHLLATETARNNKLDIKIREQDRHSTKLRNEVNDGINREKDLEAELETIRNISNNLLFQKQSTENLLKHLEQQISQKNTKIEQIEQSNEKIQNDIDNISKETLHADDYARELDKKLKQESNRLFHMEKEFSNLQNQIMSCTHELNEAKTTEKVLESRKKNLESTVKNINTKIATLDSSRIKQVIEIQELEYNLEKLQERIKKMEGGTANEEEKLKMEAEKSRLLVIVDEKNSVFDFISKEVKMMMEKLNVSTKELEASKKMNSELEEQINAAEFYIISCQKALKGCVAKKQDFLAQECLIKFQIQRYQHILKNRNESVLSLQKCKAEFEKLSKEKLQELKGCAEMLRTEIRAEEEECHAVKMKLHMCNDKVSKLQTRYQVLVDALGLTELGEKTQVDLIVKAENEKTALQYERDKLISSLVKHEDELIALNNTLWLINANNEEFRKALYPPGVTVEDNQILEKLESELQQLAIQLHTNQTQLSEVKGRIAEKRQRLDEMKQHSSELKHTLEIGKNENEALSKELEGIQVKIDRADKINARLLVEAINSTGDPSIEEDIRIHLLRELRRTVSDLMFGAVETDPVLTDKLRKLFEEKGLPLPARAKRPIAPRSRSTTPVSRTRFSDGRSSRGSNDSSDGSAPGSVSPSVVSL